MGIEEQKSYDIGKAFIMEFPYRTEEELGPILFGLEGALESVEDPIVKARGEGIRDAIKELLNKK